MLAPGVRRTFLAKRRGLHRLVLRQHLAPHYTATAFSQPCRGPYERAFHQPISARGTLPISPSAARSDAATLASDATHSCLSPMLARVCVA